MGKIKLPTTEEGIGNAKRVVYGIICFVLLSFIILIVYKVKNDLEGKDIDQEIIMTSLATNLNSLYKKITGSDLKILNLPDDDGGDGGSGGDGDLGADGGLGGDGGLGADGGSRTIIDPNQAPHKTCADINGTPDNPIPFDCSDPTNPNIEPRQSPESINCLPNSGCTQIDCCAQKQDTCKLNLYRWRAGSLQDTDAGRDNRIIDNLDLSEILPQEIKDSPTGRHDPLRGWGFTPGHCDGTPSCSEIDIDIDTPTIVNCNEGRKNSRNYINELRFMYQSEDIQPGLLPPIEDYERQAIITCNNGYLNYGVGACTEAVDEEGYYCLREERTEYGRQNYEMCTETDSYIYRKECTCDDGEGAVGVDCPRNGHLWCDTCNDGSDPVLIGSPDDSPIATCRPEDHPIDCNMDDLEIPTNGQIIGDSCNRVGDTCEVICDDGYHLEGDAPVCIGATGEEGGDTGNFSYNTPICSLNTCTEPNENKDYDITNISCSNLQFGNESCSGITCKGDNTIPELSCLVDGEPLEVLGCPVVCDSSGVHHLTQIPTNIENGQQQFRAPTDDELDFRSNNCGGPGKFLTQGESCDITCSEGNTLISDNPRCEDGVLSSEVIQCSSPTCSIGTTAPENATLVSSGEEADAGNYDCTNTDTGTITTYYDREEIERAFCLDEKCTQELDQYSLDPTDYMPSDVGFSRTIDDYIHDKDGDGLSDWLEFRGNWVDNYNTPDNDDWDNRRNSGSTISWFYDMYLPNGTNPIIKNTSARVPPRYGDSCRIKCNEGFQYVEDSLQTCTEDGQEISGTGGRCELIPQERVDESDVRYVLSYYTGSPPQPPTCNDACEAAASEICSSGTADSPLTCINPIQGENYYGSNTFEVINNINSASTIRLTESYSGENSFRKYHSRQWSPQELININNDLNNYSVENTDYGPPRRYFANENYGTYQTYSDVDNRVHLKYNLGVSFTTSGNVPDTEITSPITPILGGNDIYIYLPYDNKFNIFSQAADICGYDITPSIERDSLYNYNLCKCNISNCSDGGDGRDDPEVTQGDPPEYPPCSLSSITQPVNGQWGQEICASNDGNIQQGQSCDLTCDVGYSLTDQPSCGLNGELTSTTATCIPQGCTTPDTTGYTVTETNLAFNSFNVDVGTTCAQGYDGSPSVERCATPAGEYILSGCTPQDCIAPADTTGYVIGDNSNLAFSDDFNVNVTCATGYSGTPSAEKCNLPGQPYTLSGCNLDFCRTPSPTPEGYLCPEGNQNCDGTIDNTKISDFQVSGWECDTDAGYTGTAEATPCNSNGADYNLTGCTLTNCVNPTGGALQGYHIWGAEGNFSPTGFNISGIECAGGYDGTPSAQGCDTEGQPYTLSGCSPCCLTAVSGECGDEQLCTSPDNCDGWRQKSFNDCMYCCDSDAGPGTGCFETCSRCKTPTDTEGYIITETDLRYGQFSVSASCDNGYTGRARVDICDPSGHPYTLSGCTLIE